MGKDETGGFFLFCGSIITRYRTYAVLPVALVVAFAHREFKRPLVEQRNGTFVDKELAC